MRMGETMARKLITASLALAALAASAPAIAQSYPSKPIRLLVGFPAGGPSDVPARLIAAKMQASLGQPVTVENKTGAAGMIALRDMLAQPRDGHTLLLCSYIDAINPLIYKKVDYKLDEVVPISLVQKAYYAIAVPNALPVNSLQEFIAHAKANPGKLNYGRVGTGSVTEVVPRQFEKISGISMTGVTFRGTGPALQEVVANRLEFMVGPISLTMPLLEGKQLKVLAMTSPERLATAPSVPTMKEQGVPIVSEGWWGVCAASDTPAPVLEAINKQVVAAVNSPDFKTPIEKTGVIAGSTSLADAATIWKETANEAEKLYKKIGFERVD
jgi:tripartite-type tricarboxylate transporter receptor subunit TctC